jgi:hypothetical protein
VTSTTSAPAATFGQIAAAVIIRTKRAAEAEGRVYRQSDLAATIDALLPAYLEQHPRTAEPATFSLEPTPPAKEAPPQHFGTGKEMPPPPAFVTAYSASIGYPIDGQKWCDSYAAKGWIVSGKAKMKDWHAAVRNWKTNRWGRDNGIALITSTAPAEAQPAGPRYSRI